MGREEKEGSRNANMQLRDKFIPWGINLAQLYWEAQQIVQNTSKGLPDQK
jgi:hypothetical protein